MQCIAAEFAEINHIDIIKDKGHKLRAQTDVEITSDTYETLYETVFKDALNKSINTRHIMGVIQIVCVCVWGGSSYSCLSP